MLTFLVACVFLDDPVDEKLKAAKESHRSELAELKEPTLKWIEKQEATIKRGGDKKAAKEWERLRGLFEANHELPPGLPANLQKKYSAATARSKRAFKPP